MEYGSADIIFFSAALGVLMAFVLGALPSSSKRKKKTVSTISFVCITAKLFQYPGDASVFLYFRLPYKQIYLQIGLFGLFLIGPSLYYFSDHVLKKKWTVLRIPGKIGYGPVMGAGIIVWTGRYSNPYET